MKIEIDFQAQVVRVLQGNDIKLGLTFLDGGSKGIEVYEGPLDIPVMYGPGWTEIIAGLFNAFHHTDCDLYQSTQAGDQGFSCNLNCADVLRDDANLTDYHLLSE